MLALEVSNATKRYGDSVGIEGISFEVKEREPTAILGPSGCGKTTTLRAIAGLIRLDEGAVRISGSDVTRLRPYERGVGLVFQTYALFPHMTVRENVAYGLKMRGTRPAEAGKKVAGALETVRLSGFEDRWPRQLSGGEQQRVALARSIVTEPAVLLLDEPLSNLDAKLRRDMRLELRRIFQNVNTTPIIVTHDQTEALGLGERVIVMKKGTIAQIGSPTDIYVNPASRFVADFIGEMNWFEGTYQAEASHSTCGFQSVDGLFLRVSTRGSGRVNGSKWLGVRPERISVVSTTRAKVSSDAKTNVLTGRVESAEVVGGNIDLVVHLEDSQSSVRVAIKNSGPLSFSIGEKVSVVIDADDCIPIDDDS